VPANCFSDKFYMLSKSDRGLGVLLEMFIYVNFFNKFWKNFISKFVILTIGFLKLGKL